MREPIDPTRLTLNNYSDKRVIDTQYSDLDALGHLNNVSIARFYQDARARLFAELFERTTWNKSTEGNAVLVKATLQYFAEGFFPEPVAVGMRVGEVGNSSYTLQQGLFQNDRCIGVCDVIFVFMVDGKSQRIPDSMRSKLLEKVSNV